VVLNSTKFYRKKYRATNWQFKKDKFNNNKNLKNATNNNNDTHTSLSCYKGSSVITQRFNLFIMHKRFVSADEELDL